MLTTLQYRIIQYGKYNPYLGRKQFNPRMISHLLIVVILILQVQVYGQLPQGFTVVRNVHTWVTYDDYLTSIAKPSYDSRLNILSGYNMVSLAGFTETSTFLGMDDQLSPLLTWKKVYEMILGNKPNIYGSSSNQVQKQILENVFHINGSKLMMHVELAKSPVSGSSAINATALGQQIVTTVTELQLDGVSLLFTDYNSVKDNTGSEWLETLLRYIRINTQNADITIVLIIPPTFVGRMRIFKSTDINYLVDYFVLKYYGTVQADYTNYQTIFENSAYYPGTSMFEILGRSDIYLDICRTLVAKPADQTATWSYTQFTSSTDLNNIFGQAYTKLGWFGGFANLNYETDKSLNFVNTALSGLRQSCTRDQNCMC